MRTDFEDGDQGDAAAARPGWALGSRVATWNVAAARKAYLRYAEVAERTLNEVDSTTAKVGRDALAVARGARRTLLRQHGHHAAAHDAPDRRARRGASTVRAKVERGHADFRDIAFRGQVAADTNVRAYLDHLDDLATAPSARHLLSAQTAFVWDQWQRTLQQAFDLQQRTVGALRKITSAPTA